MRERVSTSVLPLLLVGYVACVSLFMLLLEPWGHDLWFHLHRLQDLGHQIADGRLYVHFQENLLAGKGLPVWIYYSQWAYWPTLPLILVGVSPLIALKLVFSFFFVLSSLGCYRLLFLHVDTHLAALGTLLYATANYVIGDIFVRSAYPEFLSYALLPWLLIGLHSAFCNSDKRAGISVVTIAALMILFHPLSFMNAGLGITAYGAFVFLGHKPFRYRRLLKAATLLAFALALTSFYWLPALVEMRYVLGTDGMPIRLEDTFLTIQRYFNVVSINSLGFMLTLVGFGVIASILLRRHKTSTGRQEHPRWALAAGILAYVFLTLSFSEPVWASVPFLAANNFVWRLHFPLTLLVVFFVTAELSSLPQSIRNHLAFVGLGGLAVAQGAVFILWHTWDEVSLQYMPLSEIETELAEEGRRTDGWGIDEYRPDSRTIPIRERACRAIRSVDAQGSYEMTFLVVPADADTCVHVPRYWNARYEGSINGTPLPVYANAEGEILLMPAGKTGRVSLHFGRPVYVRFADLVSAIAAACVLAFIVLVPWARAGNRDLAAG